MHRSPFSVWQPEVQLAEFSLQRNVKLENKMCFGDCRASEKSALFTSPGVVGILQKWHTSTGRWTEQSWQFTKTTEQHSDCNTFLLLPIRFEPVDCRGRLQSPSHPSPSTIWLCSIFSSGVGIKWQSYEGLSQETKEIQYFQNWVLVKDHLCENQKLLEHSDTVSTKVSCLDSYTTHIIIVSTSLLLLSPID